MASTVAVPVAGGHANGTSTHVGVVDPTHCGPKDASVSADMPAETCQTCLLTNGFYGRGEVDALGAVRGL